MLHALIDANLEIELADEASAAASAKALMEAVGGKLGISILERYDQAQERWQLRLEKILHGNLKVGIIDEDLLVSGDYVQPVSYTHLDVYKRQTLLKPKTDEYSSVFRRR